VNIHFLFATRFTVFATFFKFSPHPPIFLPHPPFIFATPPYFRYFFTPNRHKPFGSNPDPPGQHDTSSPEKIGGCGENIGGVGENLKKVAKTVNRVAKKIKFMKITGMNGLGWAETRCQCGATVPAAALQTPFIVIDCQKVSNICQ
jgi:hypothetical protein